MDAHLKTYLLEFLNELDDISEEHGELGDTDCRERLTDALVLAFLKPQVGYTLPADFDFGMFSDEGNAKVRAAFDRYVSRATARAAELGLNTPNERLSALNQDVVSKTGNCGDDYFAWLESVDNLENE